MRQRVVGDGEEHELGPGDDRGDVGEGHAGQEVGGPGPARVRHRVGTGQAVSRARQGRAEHRADPTGADDPHGQPGRVLDAVHAKETTPSAKGQRSREGSAGGGSGIPRR